MEEPNKDNDNIKKDEAIVMSSKKPEEDKEDLDNQEEIGETIVIGRNNDDNINKDDQMNDDSNNKEEIGKLRSINKKIPGNNENENNIPKVENNDNLEKIPNNFDKIQSIRKAKKLANKQFKIRRCIYVKVEKNNQ